MSKNVVNERPIENEAGLSEKEIHAAHICVNILPLLLLIICDSVSEAVVSRGWGRQ